LKGISIARRTVASTGRNSASCPAICAGNIPDRPARFSGVPRATQCLPGGDRSPQRQIGLDRQPGMLNRARNPQDRTTRQNAIIPALSPVCWGSAAWNATPRAPRRRLHRRAQRPVVRDPAGQSETRIPAAVERLRRSSSRARRSPPAGSSRTNRPDAPSPRPQPHLLHPVAQTGFQAGKAERKIAVRLIPRGKS